MWSPVRKALGARPSPATSASGTPSASTPAASTAPAAERPVRVVRRRPAARVRLVVPAARRPGQRRLRRAARRHPPDPGHEGACGPACSTVRTSAPRSGRTPSSRAGTRRGRSRPASTGPRSPTGRVLFVGDAAMATDVMTGEGIGQALLTGRLAAEAIVAGGALDPPAPRRRYARRRAPPPRRRPPDVGRARPGARPRARRPRRHRRSSTTPAAWGRRNFARWMFEDEPRAVAAHPVALAPPGAGPPRPVRRDLIAPTTRTRPALRGRGATTRTRPAQSGHTTNEPRQHQHSADVVRQLAPHPLSAGGARRSTPARRGRTLSSSPAPGVAPNDRGVGCESS